MAIVKMQKLSIVASKKHRKAILEALQKTGAMEMRVDSIDDPELIHMDTDGARTQFEKTADSFDKALAALNEASPQKDPSGGLFGEKDQVSQADFDRVIGNRENLVADANDILKLVRERAECEGTIAKDRNQIAGLSPWMNLGIPMNSTGTGRTTIFIGTIPEALDEAGLYAAASMGLQDPAPVTGEILSTSPEGTYITVVALNSVADTVSQNLRNIGFSRPATASSYVPRDAVEILEGDIKDQEDRILLIGTEISDFADRREDFRIAADYFRTRAEKYRLLGKIPQTEHAFFIEGWVTAACAPKITKLLTEKFDAYVENEDKREDEVEPSFLQKYGRRPRVLRPAPARQSRPDLHHVVFLCLVLRNDAFRRGLRHSDGNRMRHYSREAQAPGGRHEEIPHDVLLVRPFDHLLGLHVRGLLRRRD